MQTLKLAPDLFHGIDIGEKTCTIRKGKRDINLGPLLLEATEGSDTREVFVYEVRIKTLHNLTQDEAYCDGRVTTSQLKEAMKRFYPDITPEDIITVIFFEYEIDAP